MSSRFPFSSFFNSRRFKKLAEAPSMDAMGSLNEGDEGYGRYDAEGVIQSYNRIAENNPYRRAQDALGTAIERLQAELDARIINAAASPLLKAAKKIRDAGIPYERAARGLQGLLDDSNTPDKALAKAAKSVRSLFATYDKSMKGVPAALRKSMKVIEDHVANEARANIARNYENLHMRTAMGFAAAEKGVKYVSIAVGAIASLVGHPEVGPAFKAAVGSALKVTKASVKFFQKRQDFADDDTRQQAESLLGHDRENVISVAKIKQIGSAALNAAKFTLDSLGVDTTILDEIKGFIPGIEAAVNQEISQATKAVADKAKREGAPVQVDELNSQVDSAIKKVIAKAKKDLKKRGEDAADRLLAKMENKVRGARQENPLDLDSLATDLDQIGTDLAVGVTANDYLNQIRDLVDGSEALQKAFDDEVFDMDVIESKDDPEELEAILDELIEADRSWSR